MAVHHAKQLCITDLICNEEYGEIDEDGVCRFTEFRVQEECKRYHPSLGDYRIAKRHLDEQVAQGLLDVTYLRGVKEYVLRRELGTRRYIMHNMPTL